MKPETQRYRDRVITGEMTMEQFARSLRADDERVFPAIREDALMQALDGWPNEADNREHPGIHRSTDRNESHGRDQRTDPISGRDLGTLFPLSAGLALPVPGDGRLP